MVHTALYKYRFFYHKYGLQHKLAAGQVSLESTSLRIAIADFRRIDCESLHLVVNTGTKGKVYLFWGEQRTEVFLRGKTRRSSYRPHGDQQCNLHYCLHCSVESTSAHKGLSLT